MTSVEYLQMIAESQPRVLDVFGFVLNNPASYLEEISAGTDFNIKRTGICVRLLRSAEVIGRGRKERNMIAKYIFNGKAIDWHRGIGKYFYYVDNTEAAERFEKIYEKMKPIVL